MKRGVSASDEPGVEAAAHCSPQGRAPETRSHSKLTYQNCIDIGCCRIYKHTQLRTATRAGSRSF